MKEIKKQKSKHNKEKVRLNYVGARLHPCPNRGITLIALVITIIVMLILVAVTITMAINGGLFEHAGQAVEDTQNEIDKEQQLASGKVEIDGKWYNSIDDYLDNTTEVNVAKGSFVEYGVAYTDAYISKEYTTTNGWRLLDYTNNGDGTISNVKLISTGIPAKLYYNDSDSSTNKSWWVTTESSEDPTVPNLTDFKEVLGGEDNYDFYTGTLSTYYGLQASAGMYYNFGDIKFAYGTSSRGYNLGYFTSITSGGTTYDANNTDEKTGNDLFKVRNDVTSVRLLTLKEVNEALGRTDIDSESEITKDSIGLYRLDQLKNVTGMLTYDYDYSSNGSISSYYWLASPRPSDNLSVCHVISNGYVNISDFSIFGVRPVAILDPEVRYTVDSETDSSGISYLTLTAE